MVATISKSIKFTSQCVTILCIPPRRFFSNQLTEQQTAVRMSCRQFAEKHLKPGAAICDSEARFPVNHIKQLANHGLMGANVSEKYGGKNLDLLSMVLAVEELSRGCASTGMVFSIHNFLYADLLNNLGTDLQKQEFLAPFTRGSIGCFALSEPDAGSDVANIHTTATQDKDYWILNGVKSWVTSAIEGQAMLVFATCNKELRHNGLACFLVPTTAEGVFRGRKELLMGIRAVTACDVTLENVRVSQDCMVGGIGQGFKIAMGQLDRGRIAIAAHAVGIAQSALDTAVDYARTRVAFGKPLAQLPSVKDRIAEMSILIESARLLTYRAAVDVTTKNSSMAKYVAGKNAQAVSDHCVQILGGRGLSKQYPAERHYRDARGTQIYGGVTDVQKKLIGHFALKEYNASNNVVKVK